MKRLAFSTAVLLAAGFIFEGGSRLGLISAATDDVHAYFVSLSRRSDVWKSYSLRTAAQVASRQTGGFGQNAQNSPQWVTYAPDTDTDRHRQDAAKVTIPAFRAETPLTQPIGANDTVLTMQTASRSGFPTDRVINVDREVMTVVKWLTDTTIQVSRGSFGTQRAPHAAGAWVGRASNSLQSQIRLPLGTEDGHTYFFTWDAYWTDSFIGAGNFNHKAFQFSSGGRDGDTIWLEPDMKYGGGRTECGSDDFVGGFHARGYNTLGGPASWLLTDGNALGPAIKSREPLDQVANFCVEANTWVRFFVQIKQRGSDYDYVDSWIADESRDPVQVHLNLPLSVRPTGPTPHSIAKFWLEFNTSVDDHFRLDNRDLIAYVRNFVALRDAGDPRSLLVRPAPGAQPATGPAPPRNVRIVTSS